MEMEEVGYLANRNFPLPFQFCQGISLRAVINMRKFPCLKFCARDHFPARGSAQAGISLLVTLCRRSLPYLWFAVEGYELVGHILCFVNFFFRYTWEWENKDIFMRFIISLF